MGKYAEKVKNMTPEEKAELRAWVDEQMDNWDETARKTPPMTAEQKARYDELFPKASRHYSDKVAKGYDEERFGMGATVESIKKAYPEAKRGVEYKNSFIAEGVEGYFQSEAEVDEFRALNEQYFLNERAQGLASEDRQKGQNNE